MVHLSKIFQIREFLSQVPRLIIENNIHGVDIDPRAVKLLDYLSGYGFNEAGRTNLYSQGIVRRFVSQISYALSLC